MDLRILPKDQIEGFMSSHTVLFNELEQGLQTHGDTENELITESTKKDEVEKDFKLLEATVHKTSQERSARVTKKFQTQPVSR